MDWTDIARAYAQACGMDYAQAYADVSERRVSNGDVEARRWFERVIAGESLAWNDIAVGLNYWQA
jgi:hypothetical protein